MPWSAHDYSREQQQRYRAMAQQQQDLRRSQAAYRAQRPPEAGGRRTYSRASGLPLAGVVLIIAVLIAVVAVFVIAVGMIIGFLSALS